MACGCKNKNKQATSSPQTQPTRQSSTNSNGANVRRLERRIIR